MILGIGADIVDIRRIRMALLRPDWLQRTCSQGEIDFLTAAKADCAQRVAGNFAAKESVLKALGSGLSLARLREIEILRGEAGQPVAVLSGSMGRRLALHGAARLWVSISHEKEYAVAQAIWEGVSEWPKS